MMAVATIVLAACSTGSSPTAVATTPSNKAEPPARPPVVDDELAFLPAKSELVLGVDGAAFRTSSIWQVFASTANARLDPFRTLCGVDPIAATDRLAISGNVADDRFAGVMVVRGRMRDLFACAERSAGDKVSREGDVLVMTLDRGDKAAAIMVGTQTLVVQFGPDANAASLQRVIAGGAPLRGSPAFMTLYNRRESGATAWFMINGNAGFMAPLAQLGMKPRAIDGTVTVGNEVTGAMRMGFPDAQQAAQVAQQMSSAIKPVLQFVDKLDVHAREAVVQFDLVVTKDQMMALTALMGLP